MDYPAANRDVDRALAERLFGFTINESTPVHFYSAEISEAMQCVEKLNPRTFYLERLRGHRSVWYAVDIGDGFDLEVHVQRNSAALAICLAVLEYMDRTGGTLPDNEEACP